MTEDPDAALVEAVARAMCRASGEDPDGAFVGDGYDSAPWLAYMDAARLHIAAVRVIMAAERDGGRG